MFGVGVDVDLYYCTLICYYHNHLASSSTSYVLRYFRRSGSLISFFYYVYLTVLARVPLVTASSSEGTARRSGTVPRDTCTGSTQRFGSGIPGLLPRVHHCRSLIRLNPGYSVIKSDWCKKFEMFIILPVLCIINIFTCTSMSITALNIDGFWKRLRIIIIGLSRVNISRLN